MSASLVLAFVVGAVAGSLLTLATAALWSGGGASNGRDEHEEGI